MPLTKLNENLNIHQSNPDKPTDTSEELKRKFDKAANVIKDFINEILIKEIDIFKINVEDIVNNYTGGKNKVASAEIVKLLNIKVEEIKDKIEDNLNTVTINIEALSDNKADKTDNRFTDSRKCNNTFDNSEIARANLGLKSGALITYSSGLSTPSGGSNGDVYDQYF